jgi:hypothetical protein
VLEDRLVPATYTVNTLADTGAGTGLTGDLRYCITQADANPGSTVQFDATLFAATQTITLSGTELPVLTADTTILGPAAALTLSGNQKSRVFEIGDSTHNPVVAMFNLTITQGGAITGNGGGMLEIGGSLTLTDCTLSGNDTNPGGSGGGITNGGTLILNTCTLSGNAAFNGGGLDNEGTATLSSCTLSGNSAEGSALGGGIFNGGTLTLSNCTLSGNFAENGGGGGGTGGGIANSGTLLLSNCTLSGNSAGMGESGFGGKGSGIANTGMLTMNNTVVAGNFGQGFSAPGGDIDGAVASSSSHNLIGNGAASGLSDGANGNHVGSLTNPIDPLLAPLGSYGGPTQTIALLPGSPAIDAGSNALAVDAHGIPLTTDQRGLPRVVNGMVDIGAFESQGFNLTAQGGGNQTATAGTTFPNAFSVRVTANNSAEPVQGGMVTFTAPASGSSGTFANGQATATAAIDSSGTATAPAFVATATAGTYAVTASAAGAAPVSFQLANQTSNSTPPTPSTPPTSPGLSTSERFVFHLYTDLLGRSASQAEVNFLGALLDRGIVTRAQLAQFFLQSFEYLTRQVDQLYVRLLGRLAEPAAQAVGTAFLVASGRQSQLEAIVLGSDEYLRLHGGTDAGFLAGLGQDVAGGALDPGDVSLFRAELATGTPRFVVALQALALPQAAAAKAQLYYQKTLKRSASSSELFFPTFMLLAGNDTATLLALLSSDEYARLP